MYICCHRAGKAKDLYSRSFLLDEKTPRRDGRVARERQDEEREIEKEKDREELYRAELREDCHESGKRKEKTTGRRKEEREEGGERRGRWTEGGGRQERGSRRTGRINKRNAPPSHLRHLYFAAPRGRKSSSVSERGDTARRGEARRGGEQKGRQGVPRVKDHGHLPRARAQRSSLTLSPDDTSAVMTARDRQIRGRKRESSLFFL